MTATDHQPRRRDIDDWRDLAECKGMNPATFLPGKGERPNPHAIATCNRCEVRTQCLNHAIREKEIGVWGGTTERERRRIRSNNHHANPPAYATDLICAVLAGNPGQDYTIAELSRHIHRRYDTTRQAVQVLRREGTVKVTRRYPPHGTQKVVYVRMNEER